MNAEDNLKSYLGGVILRNIVLETELARLQLENAKLTEDVKVANESAANRKKSAA